MEEKFSFKEAEKNVFASLKNIEVNLDKNTYEKLKYDLDYLNLYVLILKRDGMKEKLEKLWSVYKCFGNKKIINDLFKSRMNFYTYFWEMYCSVGLINLGFRIKANSNKKGPDIELDMGEEKVHIECIAVGPGTGKDEIPHWIQDEKGGYTFKVPNRELKLRISSALKDKKDRLYTDNPRNKYYKNYYLKEIVKEHEGYVIALGGMQLKQYGSLMDDSVKSVLYDYDETIYNSNKKPVGLGVFNKTEFSVISGVLFSNQDVLNSNDKPEETLQLFVNPNAKNKLPEEFITQFKKV